jgi:hypothetical protein
MNHDCTELDWKPILLVKVTHSVWHCIEGILRTDRTLPTDERFLPLVEFTGRKSEREVLLSCPPSISAARE